MYIDVLIIGAGHGGVSVAAELRRAGFAGSIMIVDAGDLAPYHRPPLSKAWLKGDADDETGWLQPPGFFEAHGIDLRSGTRVTSLDADAHLATTSLGEEIRFADAVIATGATARALSVPGADTVPLLQLRDASDARRLRAALGRDARLVIIGGGFVGLEVAATATSLGLSVCVLERESRVLARLASEPLSRYLAQLHADRGVEIIVGATIEGVGPGTADTISITLGRDDVREFDHALVAIGAEPLDSLAKDAGIACANGISVDECGRTSASNIYAVGDVSRRPLHPYADSARLESVHNANEQARIVAAQLSGEPSPAISTPWFWSDQFDAKLQIAGLLPPEADVEVRGDPQSGSFALLHRIGGRLVCVEAVNSSKEFAMGRREIAAASRP